MRPCIERTNSVDDDPDAQTQIVLTRSGYNEWCPNCLKRSRREHDPGLLIAAIDDVPVYLDHTQVEPAVQLDVEPAAERHREARFVCMKVADAEDCRQVRTIDVELLHGNAEKCVSKRLEVGPSSELFFT